MKKLRNSLAGEAVAIKYRPDPGRAVDLRSSPDRACIRFRCRAGTIPSLNSKACANHSERLADPEND